MFDIDAIPNHFRRRSRALFRIQLRRGLGLARAARIAQLAASTKSRAHSDYVLSFMKWRRTGRAASYRVRIMHCGQKAHIVIRIMDGRAGLRL